MTTPEPVRVAVVSRYPLVRAGLVCLLSRDPGRAVVVDTASQDGHLGDRDLVVVYDLAGLAPGDDDLGHLLASGASVVGLTRNDRDDLAASARVLGIHEIVPEDVSAERLLEAIKDAAVPGQRRGEGLALTPRELEVIGMIASGYSNQQIATELYVSINTVKTYIRSAYRKIGAHRRPEAQLWAIHNGLVQVGDNTWALRPPTGDPF